MRLEKGVRQWVGSTDPIPIIDHHVHNTYTQHTTTCYGSCQGHILAGARARECMLGFIWPHIVGGAYCAGSDRAG